MIYNLPILYPLGFFENLTLLNEVLVSQYNNSFFFRSLEELPLIIHHPILSVYSNNYFTDHSRPNVFNLNKLYLNWMLLYPVLVDIYYIDISSTYSLNVCFTDVLEKDFLTNSKNIEYWTVLPVYSDNNDFKLSFYFYLNNSWALIEFLTPVLPYYFVSFITPALSESLVISVNSFGLLAENIIQDDFIWV